MLLACTLAAATVTDPALAQEPTEEDIEQARAQFMRAVEYEQAQNWSKALELFRAVGQVKLTPQVRYHIAYCEENLGKLVAALGGYKLALNDADQVGPDFRAEVEGRIANLLARIPKLNIKRGEGAEAATIALDGVELGVRSIGSDVNVDPGPHTIAATAPGHQDFMETVLVDERQKETLTVNLQPIEEPKPVGGGDTGGDLGGDTGRKDTGVSKPPDRTLPYIIGGSGAGAVLVGGVFLFLQMSAVGSAEDMCGGSVDNCDAPPDEQDEVDSKLDTAQVYNYLSIGFAGAGVAALGVAGYLILTEPKKPAEAMTGLRLAPVAPGADAGLSLIGRF
jgi:hypothetical protein